MKNLIGLFLAFFPLLAITLVASFKIILWLFYDEIESIIKFSINDSFDRNFELNEKYILSNIKNSFKQAIREVYEENKNK